MGSPEMLSGQSESGKLSFVSRSACESSLWFVCFTSPVVASQSRLGLGLDEGGGHIGHSAPSRDAAVGGRAVAGDLMMDD